MLVSVTWTKYLIFPFNAGLVYCLLLWIVFVKADISFLSGRGSFGGVSLYSEDSPDEFPRTTQHPIDEIRLLIDRSNKNGKVVS